MIDLGGALARRVQRGVVSVGIGESVSVTIPKINLGTSILHVKPQGAIFVRDTSSPWASLHIGTGYIKDAQTLTFVGATTTSTYGVRTNVYWELEEWV
ncbi:hypothetical protein A7D02_19715 [Aeromonas salmonicida]|nr:hypothetical protein A7D02_19715 [Aeromonas salmonicida]ORJ15707.1 hypothetical protein A7D03_16370 [Aeromonas salmonicida]